MASDDRPVVLGVDIGTSSTKVVAFDDAGGAPRARAELAYPLLESGHGRAEQDPAVILAAMVSTIREAAEAAWAQEVVAAVVAVAAAEVLAEVVVVDAAAVRLRPTAATT